MGAVAGRGRKMKNLKLCLELGADVELQSEDESLLFSAFDIEHDRMFFSSSSGVIHTLHLNPSQVRVCICCLLCLCYSISLAGMGPSYFQFRAKAANLQFFLGMWFCN